MRRTRKLRTLVEQVKYEQVVQWLGDDPHLYERLQRYLRKPQPAFWSRIEKFRFVASLVCRNRRLIGTMLFRHRGRRRQRPIRMRGLDTTESRRTHEPVNTVAC